MNNDTMLVSRRLLNAQIDALSKALSGENADEDDMDSLIGLENLLNAIKDQLDAGNPVIIKGC